MKRRQVFNMGWAKYDEDNRELLEDRWAMRNTYFSPAVTQKSNNKKQTVAPSQKKATKTTYHYPVR